jgi:acyl carrier protein
LADGDGLFLRTGDLGVIDQGHLFVTGRLKDVIILRGRNYYPQDIERTVERCHAALRPNAGAAVSVEANGEESLAIIHEVDRAYRDIDLSEVVRAIRRAVSDEHEVHPHAIVLIRHASLPVTTSGKVQRSLARRLYLAGELNVLEEWIAPQQGAAISRNGGYVNGNGHPRAAGRKNGVRHQGANGHPAPTRVNGANGRSAAIGSGHLGNGNGNGKPASHNGHAAAGKIARIQFDHFPLTTEEMDRLAERIEKWILDWMVEHAAIAPGEIDRHRPFAEYGMDSLTAVELSHQLEEWLGVELTAVVAWNYPTPHKISQYLARTVGGAETAAPDAHDSAEDSADDDFERLLAEIENLSESEAQDALSRDP